ncbi:hypothetical protein [Pseudomonas putida]|uniref:DNA methyltransferase n=1 Tax=Pseudomonas putida TaxID=303 RepID=A0A177SAV3_PSEPU|nr:hypothetical protein [Pseudomonas putida]OAI84952.1 hypothetical protein AYO28_03470 [Pseudomonas putida]
MDLITLIIQIFSGVIGGNVAGLSKEGMGPTLNSVAGAIGGVLLGQVLAHLTGDQSLAEAGAAGTLDIPAIISSVIGGGAGGAVLTWVAGFIKSKMQAH